ncbi:DUF4349 domain-containing protein [Microbacterium pygmaeum]|uniref:DUF4349 domain-containing protein n=1 Tax=Microbacterium pygmaeum TaxID=370764 RepID=A0A1G8A252_9MICO|nr:DUF4349 domain-containing protein [Microbacterium pygmaeum]SDH14907.1 protein of unknown function [Microbacterium pygmaeum]
MNTSKPTGDPVAPTVLPELSDQSIDRIENAVFSEIGRERAIRRARRGRLWLTGGAAAAILVVAAVIAPSVGTLVGGTSMNESAVAPAVPLVATDGSAVQLDTLPESAAGGVAGDTAKIATGERDIITTATASLTVGNTADAAREIGDAAEARGGSVESMSVGASGAVTPGLDGSIDSGVVTDTMPYPTPYTGAWVTVRVPADQLPALVEELSGFGEVTASSVNRQDVTERTVDLRARVDAAQASVDRMTQILGQAANLTDLIAAESALAERQATLESYQQQLKYYDEQIAMSTLTVSLSTPTEVVTADPAGFGDGLAAGWNGLIATLNSIVIAIGFLLPWIGVTAVVVLLAWGIVRLVRRRRSNRAGSTASEDVAD